MPSATSVWSGQIGDTSNVSATVITNSVLPAITAGTTHTLAGAVPLTAQINVIAVCATIADAVALPSAGAGMIGDSFIVFNNGAAAAAVWPQAADKIDGGTAGTAVVLTQAKRCIYYCTSLNNWISAQLGVVSA